MPSKLEHALDLARRGFRLFPLIRGGREPAIKGWPEKATTDEATLRAWFGDEVFAHNIGVATGDGLVVLDVDRKKGKDGEVALQVLQAIHDDLPASLAVETPSGGWHMYFKSEREVGNNVGHLGEGLDIRGYHGFVVGPGSDGEWGAYRTLLDVPLAEAPPWLLDLCETPIKRDERIDTPAVLELDTEGAKQRATAWLKNDAPLAVEGAGGNNTTYQTAARLRDFGISEPVALDLLLEHWNERCSPPWAPDDLAGVTGNAYRYGTNRLGATSPEAEFTPIAPSNPRRQAPPLLPYTLKDVKPRRWVVHPILAKGYVTVLIAPPGAGKSTITLSLAAAIATGRGEIIDMPVKERGRVWYINNEDDQDELKLRWLAAAKHFNISWPDLALDHQPALYLESGTGNPLVIATRGGKDGRAVVPKEADDLIAEIRAKGITVLVVDPFVETHGADENDNVQIAKVAALYRRVAKEGDCAVVVVHHTRKQPAGSSEGHAGNMDSGRGASALMGVARFVQTLYGMSEKDAKRFGVAAEERHRYVRLDGAKANLAPAGGRVRWFERLSVDMAGESVGVLAPVALLEKAPVPEMALLRDVVAVLGDEKRVFTRTVMARLRERFPMYADLENDALRKRLSAALAEPVEVDGGTLTMEKTGDTTQAPTVLIFDKPRHEGESEIVEDLFA